MTNLLPKGDVFNRLPASFRALAEFAEKKEKEEAAKTFPGICSGKSTT